MEIGGKSRGEDPETSGAGVWEGQKDRDCGRSQVDQGGKVSREAGTSLVGPVGMERNLEFILSAGVGGGGSSSSGMRPTGDFAGTEFVRPSARAPVQKLRILR